MDNIVPINKETGEIIEDGYVIFTTEQLAEYRKKKENKEFKNTKINENYKEYSRFIWVIYNMGQLLFDGKISGATLTKIVYLSTYIRYSDTEYKNIVEDGKIKWIGLTSDNNKPITRCHTIILFKLLNH